MRKSCLVLGGLFLFAVVALIGVVAMTFPRWWTEGSKMVRDVVAEQKRMADLEATWTPPSEKPDAAWAPAELGEWKLKQVEAVSGWPGLDEPRLAQRMIYEHDGRTIEIGVLAANEPEKDLRIKQVVAAAQSGGGGYQTTTIGYRTHVRSGNLNTRIWWLKNWLFVLRSKDVDPTLSEPYLNAISGARKAEKE